MAKNLDVKELLIQKGERLGLGMALLVMIGLIGFGTASGVQGDSPGTTVDWIKTQASQLENRLNNGQADPLPDLERIYTKSEPFNPPINSDEYVIRTDNFQETPLEFTKRSNPPIRNPVEFRAVAIRCAIKTLVLSGQKDQPPTQMGWLVPNENVKIKAAITKEQVEYQKAYAAWAQQRAQSMAAQRGGRPAGGANWGAGMMPGLQAYSDTKGVPMQEYRVEMVPLDRPPPKDAEPAETLTPHRMVVIAGSFPYREQLELYRSHLRLPTLKELIEKKEKPEFRGFNVKRRTLDITGKVVKEDWQPVNVSADIKSIRAISTNTDADHEDLKPLIFDGLVMRRPALGRGMYASDFNLGFIAKSLRVLKDKMPKDSKSVVILQPVQRKLAAGEFDEFKEDLPVKPGEDRLPPPTRDTKDPEFLVPDHCLVRIIDADRNLKPGFTYEYQVQVRVRNPNAGRTDVAYPSLAVDPEIHSAWGPDPPLAVVMPREQFIYGNELDDKTLKQKQQIDTRLLMDKNDVAWMQVHRWIESTNVSPDQRGTFVPVGDWSVGDVPVRRGEYIGRVESVKVPMWFPHKRTFDIPVPIAAKGVKPQQQAKGIPVNFGTEDLLVDFEGGKIYQIFQTLEKGQTRRVDENANVEYLILSPDGKLHLRNSRADKLDQVRTDRFDEVAKWAQAVEDGKVKAAGGGAPKTDIFVKPGLK